MKFKLKIDKKKAFKTLFGVLLGDMLSAFALVYILKPNEMISGGVSGLSVLIESLTGLPLGLLVFILNIPLFILGLFFLDFDFMFFSGISIVVLSLWISFFETLKPLGYAITHEIILACIFGGVINGVGGGTLFKYGASAGGFDIPAAIIKKKFNIQIGNVLLFLNCFIIGMSSFIYSVDKALFTLVALFITYQVIDMIQLGVGKQKQVFIISPEYEIITEKIHEEVGRGITYINGEGSYKNNEVKIIYLICSSREIVAVKNLVREIDPNAFLAVSDTVEIQGKGFKKIEI
ncbi:YitT family protein [Anaerosphaera multitolerans]|uniref:YitT family protein n=1 Tax=Anaerosphaera multitolerans TaxID=2487351 RepID=A0A437S6U9_9FIRM|nr:YitT family protein [Anaerosphaera multitolerans]RVU54732.1 YitT family protein [Anaerosphaera multitolerans]